MQAYSDWRCRDSRPLAVWTPEVPPVALSIGPLNEEIAGTRDADAQTAGTEILAPGLQQSALLVLQARKWSER